MTQFTLYNDYSVRRCQGQSKDVTPVTTKAVEKGIGKLRNPREMSKNEL